MKYIVPIVMLLLLFSCSSNSGEIKALRDKVDRLQNELNEAYKPGFGEFMSNIQTHHAKLWFAGKNENWELAAFEIHEIIESFEDVEKFQSVREESQVVDMIYPAIDSVNHAIQLKNYPLFERSYGLLTNTCNNCHKAVDFDFNVVKIPDFQPFSNQDFKTKK